jgi:methylenetetrahydrofolate dehydrogenase (NADP+)/methenyltetrahydrofolate cyclohydrolase
LPHGQIHRILGRMKIIDGRALAAEIRATTADRISASGHTPKLAVLLVGDDSASHLYVSLKEKAAKEVGVATEIHRLPATTSDDKLVQLIETWNADDSINGILIQLPLPAGHDETRIVAAMDPKKDADGFHPKNIENLLAGKGTIISPVHEGILRLIAATDVVPNGATAALIVNSDVFAKPLAYLLEKAGSRVTTTSADDLDKKAVATAQIVIIAIGRANYLQRGMVSSNACIIDVGTNKLDDGKTVGDVDAASLENVPGWLSPVPGGVGPMTIALLLKNVTDLTLSPPSSF